MAPASEPAILAKAAADPVRGPEALYTQLDNSIPPTVVEIFMCFTILVYGKIQSEQKYEHGSKGRIEVEEGLKLRDTHPPMAYLVMGFLSRFEVLVG